MWLQRNLFSMEREFQRASIKTQQVSRKGYIQLPVSKLQDPGAYTWVQDPGTETQVRRMSWLEAAKMCSDLTILNIADCGFYTGFQIC